MPALAMTSSDGVDRLLASYQEAEVSTAKLPAWASSSGFEAKPWIPPQNEEQAPVEEAPEVVEEPPSPEELNVDEAALAALYDETRAAAHEEGYQAGYDEGVTAGQEAGSAALEEELVLLREAREQMENELRSLAALRGRLVAEAETESVELALRVGKRLAGEAQLEDLSWVAPLIRDASLALTTGDRVVCRVGIALADRLERAGQGLEIDGAVFERCHDLGPLELVVESECGRVDAGLEARFEELRAAIRRRVATVRDEPAAT